MAYVIFSEYQCIESGSLLEADEQVLVFSTEKEALTAYESRLKALLRRVEHEIEIIRESDDLVFSAPYIVSLLLVHLPKCPSAVLAVDACIRSWVERYKRPEAALRRRVLRSDGWVFSDDGTAEISASEIVMDIVEMYS